MIWSRSNNTPCSNHLSKLTFVRNKALDAKIEPLTHGFKAKNTLPIESRANNLLIDENKVRLLFLSIRTETRSFHRLNGHGATLIDIPSSHLQLIYP